MNQRSVFYFDQDCVEEILRQNFVITRLQRLSQRISLGVNSICNDFQTIGAMPHGIKRTHDCQQNLCGTNIAGRLIAPDVLFASLQS